MSVGYCCRFCKTELETSFCDLGFSPLANSFIPKDMESEPDIFLPLNVYVCSKCFLVQLPEHEKPENIFRDYAYFSSFSKSWLDHCERYVKDSVSRLNLDERSKVVEIASNDGYLLQFFRELSIPVLGVEPARNVAEAAMRKGINTVVEFFGVSLAHDLVKDGQQADLLIANNVLAHVPDINDFVAGIKVVLSRGGTVTIEFPHLLELIKHNQFDTIYHEHYSYLSLVSTMKIFTEHGLSIFDVEKLTTNLEKLVALEKANYLDSLAGYTGFMERVETVKLDVIDFVSREKQKGKTIAAYGAAAKGNTLLNYCGIGKESIDFVADLNVHKQNTLLPGSRIPVVSPDEISQAKPDFVIIMPWNLSKEISTQLAEIKAYGGTFVTLIPELNEF
jgi:2-polyprenyl-3-methyl-5-hydroxy-6-metoxy-1,4-benzoquinol methylase